MPGLGIIALNLTVEYMSIGSEDSLLSKLTQQWFLF